MFQSPPSEPKAPRHLKDYHQPLLVLIVGMILAFFLSAWVARQMDQEIASRFQRLVEHQSDHILSRFDLYTRGLKGLRGIFLENPDAVDNLSFQHYAESRNLLNELPSTLAWVYAERIMANAPEHMRTVHHLTTYHRLDSLSQPMPLNEAWVVRLAEPANSQLIGLDLASEPLHQASARRAMNTGQASLSALISPLLETSTTPGFILSLPVYKGPADSDHVVGWVLTLLQADNMLRFLTQEPELSDALDVSITDIQNSPDVIFRSHPGATSPPTRPLDLHPLPALVKVVEIEMGGRRWQLHITSWHGLYTNAERWLPFMVLVLGTLLSLILAGLLAFNIRLRTSAEARALAMTASLRKREVLLQSTLASLDDWVFALDTNGIVLDCYEPPTNSGWQARADFIGHPFSHALPPLAAVELTTTLRKVRDEASAHFEFELHNNAQRRRFLVRLTRRDHEGQFDGITLVAHDITTEHEQARALRESEERFRQFFSEAPQAILLTLDHQYADANPAALDLLGIPNLSALQHATLGVLSPLTQPDGSVSLDTMKDYMKKAREEGPQLFEWTFQRLSDGSTFPTEMHTSCIRIHNEDYYFSTITDLSFRKQNEHLLIQARDEAQAATLEKGEFLATMSHEIRTPMNGVLGMAQLLADTPLNPEQREYLLTIQQSGQSLLAIINDILDFSKIQAGKLSFEEVPFDLQVAVDETCDLLLPQIREKNLSLTLNLDPETPFHVIGDPGRFRQILLNYLSNALKFTQQGAITVSLRARDSGRGATLYELSVADTGIGISSSKQQVLFQKFAQADTTVTRRFGGTGLGLAICKALVERMGGEVSMSSTPGHGSTFRATFWMSLDPNSGHHLMPVIAASLRGTQVLIVDDVIPNLELLSKSLAKAGLTTSNAVSVAEAVTAVRAQIPRFVLLDAELPDGDAESLINALRAEPGMEKTQMILLSSRPERNDHAFCREHGVAAYLPKPARISWIISCLNILATGEHQGIVTRQTLLAHHGRGKVLPPLRNGVRILLAEDNTVNQKVAARMLEKMGCHVDLVGNGLEALVMVSQLPYDIILMDVQMPEMDGISATRNLRSQGFSTVPIIALTANSRDSDRQECRAAGMSDFLAKPIRYEDLHACLNRWL
jgi:PAS domain S-box-containing protein